MSDNWYYKRELDKLILDTGYPVSIKLTDSKGNSTRNLDLNGESIIELKAFFNRYMTKRTLEILEEAVKE